MIDVPRVPIDERGGKLFPEGTVYYSQRDRGFYAAGRQDEGFLPLSAVSGRVSYSQSASGIVRFRDETGVFIKTATFRLNTGTNFNAGTLQIMESKYEGDPRGVPIGPDSQWVERQTILMPDGKVKVIEINHGIGNKYDEVKQGKQWWRKMKDALGEDGSKITSSQMHAFVQSQEVILRTNMGPLGPGE